MRLAHILLRELRGHFLSPVSSLLMGTLLLLGSLGFLSANATLAFAQNEAVSEPPQEQSGDNESGDAVTEFKLVDPPPVKRIVMFNSGLSQVIHEGGIKGNQRVNMRFSEHDIDDVLKSLVFEDTSGGTVRSVEYNPAPDNQDVAAKSLGPALTLAQTLQKYRGETVDIQTNDKLLSGSILSVENRQTKDGFVETLTIVNDDGFVSIALREFDSVNFANEKIREEFKLAMAGLQKSRIGNSKEINLLFQGEAERDVRFSYNVDAPIWRMTYRLDLADAESSLQGWAHIDNVTGVDWTDIQLDLRSGRPQSFHVDLFAPVLAERAALGLQVFDIPADKRLITDAVRSKIQSAFGGSGSGGFGGSGVGGLFGGGGFGPSSQEGEFDITSAIRAAGKVGRSNKMVRFEIKDPVSLAAGRSAMVPVLTEKIPVELFSMFDTRQDSPVAVMVAQIKNLSATPFITGPVSLYQKGDFVGDGAMNRIESDQVAELVYGNDLAVQLEIEPRVREATIKSVKPQEDDIILEKTIRQETAYRFTNDDSLPRKFLLKVPFTEKTVSPEPARRESDVGFYTIECGAKSTIELVITQSRTETEETALRRISFADLKKWKQAGAEIDPRLESMLIKSLVDTDAINRTSFAKWKKQGVQFDAETEAKLEKRFAASDRVQKIQLERDLISRKISEIQQEQTRITGIIQVLPDGSPVVTNYLETLSQTEADLSENREKLTEVDGELRVAEKELRELVWEK